MADICDLILDDHERFRRGFAELDELRAGEASPARLEEAWSPLAVLLERHASAEEEIFYPALLRRGDRGEEETKDGISDHNEIRDAVRRARRATPGSEPWWDAVLSARRANSDHMAEEERGAIADFRVTAGEDLRQQLGRRWRQVEPGADTDAGNKDPDRYVARNR